MRDVYGLFRVTVPVGTGGTVVRGGTFGAVMISFDNGRTLEISKSFVEVLPPAGS